MTDSPVPPPELHPMNGFDPSKPAILHDQLNDQIIPWTGEDAEHWRRYASPHAPGVIEWDGLLIDGRGNVLGG
jgi:hypothetical protein